MRRVTRRLVLADQRALDWLASRTSPALDTVLPALGRAANYGRLWQAVALGLSVAGNQRTRRAALRGIVALSIASLAANVVSKRLVGRVRPVVDAIPLARKLRRAPLTTSFPSGHSASAAAFATGVAMEAPPFVSVPVAGLAAAVAGSRMVTGAHFPSDVLGGSVLGAAAAALTNVWWPRRPPGAADACRAPSVPARPTGRGVVIVVNGAAGSADGIADTLRAELPDAEVVELGDDPEEQFRKAADRADVLGVAGGDGTVNTAARHAIAAEVPLLVLPAGTLNHFARDLGVESIADAVRALRDGSAVRIDVGRVGDELFLNTWSIGLYTDLVRFRARWESRVGKWPAMLLGLRHVLRRGEPITVHVNGEPRTLWMAFAGNGRYRPQGFAPTSRPRLDDGRLDLRLVDATVPHVHLRLMLGALTRTLPWTRGYEASAPDRIRIAAPGPGRLNLTVDGEVKRGPEEVEVRAERGALVVYRP
ncbi:MAG TPA: phosphatase PAP2 family protein [Pseudonocardiaceae bacterium]|nr:phosphatase PAP2 family protein [Pseudonocardiaceae bacterium]